MSENKDCQNREDILWWDDVDDGNGVRKLRKYFNKFFCEFADYCYGYHGHLSEFPFVYKERAVISGVLPSLIRAGNEKTFVFMEQPLKKEDGTQRFLDFYIHHDNSLYLIEMKHGWNSPCTENITIDIAKKWENCINQTEDLTKKVVKNIFETKTYENIFKVAILIMPEYNFSRNKNHDFFKNKDECYGIKGHTDKLEGSFKNNEYIKEKNIKLPNLYATWKIKEDKKYIRAYKDDSCEFYSFVSFCLYVEKIK